MRVCIVPGSFDPFTMGHFDLVARASKLFDKVYVAIMTNSEKKGYFDFRQRKLIAEETCKDLPNVSVITADGMLSDLCSALGVCAIVKGVRNVTDFDYETTLASVNRHLAPDVETVFIPTNPKYSHVCSSFVREMLKYDQPLLGILHIDAIKLIKVDFKKEKQD
ncbi:MAG: pantetheine-phosphate adenylyltransferase [Clostridia bacterium]|nr:pantetheine-phosphate adenylyltransferase [Clostridia bacterium]